jgi:hypothetical protein
LLPELDRVAKENISKYRSESQRCFSIDCVLGDASEFDLPADPAVLYLFNPLPESGLISMINRLEDSLRRNPRPVFVIYHNQLLGHRLAQRAAFRKILATHQYSIFAVETVQPNANDWDRTKDSPGHRDSRSSNRANTTL